MKAQLIQQTISLPIVSQPRWGYHSLVSPTDRRYVPGSNRYELQPLDFDNLESAVQLVNKIFIDVSNPGLDMQRSMLYPTHRCPETGRMVCSSDYWVIVDVTTSKVVGTIGLYNYSDDREPTKWVDWFCVDPATRGSGLGSFLLDFVIEKARSAQAWSLRLITDTLEYEKAANHLYEKKGLLCTALERLPGESHLRLYRVLRFRPFDNCNSSS